MCFKSIAKVARDLSRNGLVCGDSGVWLPIGEKWAGWEGGCWRDAVDNGGGGGGRIKNNAVVGGRGFFLEGTVANIKNSFTVVRVCVPLYTTTTVHEYSSSI